VRRLDPSERLVGHGAGAIGARWPTRSHGQLLAQEIRAGGGKPRQARGQGWFEARGPEPAGGCRIVDDADCREGWSEQDDCPALAAGVRPEDSLGGAAAGLRRTPGADTVPLPATRRDDVQTTHGGWVQVREVPSGGGCPSTPQRQAHPRGGGEWEVQGVRLRPLCRRSRVPSPRAGRKALLSEPSRRRPVPGEG